jgi:opacity protein-like surface antigen
MGGVRVVSCAAALAAFASAASAADLPAPVLPVPVAEFSGWYLRGDIGMSNQSLKRMSHPSFATAPQYTFLDSGGFDAAPFFGLGIGYQFNNWLRIDVTGEYRGKANFHALDRYFNPGLPGFVTNDYNGSKSEWVGLVNAYLDLGTWWCITPFIGGGIGVAYNTISHFRDTNVIASGGGWAPTGSKTNLAWALYAGAAYKVTPSFAVELAYRYMNLGDAQTGTLVNLDPTVVSGNPLAPMTFETITSHDIKLGVRWMLQPDIVAPPVLPPLISKG